MRGTKLVCIIANKNVAYQKFYLSRGKKIKIMININFLFPLAGNTVSVALILATLQLKTPRILGVKIRFFPVGT